MSLPRVTVLADAVRGRDLGERMELTARVAAVGESELPALVVCFGNPTSAGSQRQQWSVAPPQASDDLEQTRPAVETTRSLDPATRASVAKWTAVVCELGEDGCGLDDVADVAGTDWGG